MDRNSQIKSSFYVFFTLPPRMCVKGEENIQSILDEYLTQLGENGADDLTWMYLDDLLAREEGE